MEPWILLSLLSFFAGVIFFMIVRVIKQRKTDTDVYLFYLFLVMGIMFFSYMLMTGSNPLIGNTNFLLVLIASILAFLTNYCIFKGVENSPNIGYSLTVSNTFIIIITIASVFLFGADFGLLKFIGVMLAFISSFFVSYSKKKSKKKNRWIGYAIASSLIVSVQILMFKHLLNMGIAPEVYLGYLSFIVALIFLIKARGRIYDKRAIADYGLFLLLGIVAFFFNLFVNLGYEVAPNPGYVSAINKSSVIFVTIGGYYFFKDELSPMKLAGIIGVACGIFLMVI